MALPQWGRGVRCPPDACARVRGAPGAVACGVWAVGGGSIFNVRLSFAFFRVLAHCDFVTLCSERGGEPRAARETLSLSHFSLVSLWTLCTHSMTLDQAM